MRVLLNCFGFLKPATIITEREWFSECQYPLFIADISTLNTTESIKKGSDAKPSDPFFHFLIKLQ